jgi:PilZ domain
MAHSEVGIAGPTQGSFRELRRWPRLRIRVPVAVIVHKANKTVYVDGRGTDLNEGGIAVFAGSELGIGEEVEISFTPPYHGEPLIARTIIRNRRGYIYGMEFVTETKADQARVERIRQVLRALGSEVA